MTALFHYVADTCRAWSVNSCQPVPITSGDEYSFRMQPHESIIVVFSPALWNVPACNPMPAARNAQPLHGWKMTVGGICVESDIPISWESIPELANFSGEGIYECTFESETESAAIQLSHVSAAARIWLNGEMVGDIWTHPLVLPLNGKLKQGTNHLRIVVYSTLINEMMVDGNYEKLPDVLPEWPYYGNVINIQRKARLNCLREYTAEGTFAERTLG